MYNKELINNLKLRSPLYSIEVKDNLVKLYCKKLLHTQTTEDNSELSFYLLPFLKGNYVAKLEIICEELSEPQLYEIPVIVQ